MAVCGLVNIGGFLKAAQVRKRRIGRQDVALAFPAQLIPFTFELWAARLFFLKKNPDIISLERSIIEIVRHGRYHNIYTEHEQPVLRRLLRKESSQKGVERQKMSSA